ncbi:Derepression protein [Salmonella enterica subsp. enterica serovar Muenchen]|nr:Derepression protein [Salmonella enterica subsp. enterica serovar Muenchen]
MKTINVNGINSAVIPHLSPESYHKLNRARNVAFQMHLHIRGCDLNAMPLLWLPDIFSYISDDMTAVLQEVKRLGICDKYLESAAPENKE